MSFLDRLEWRHATKAFEATKKVPTNALEKILMAIRMAPTSYGLQPFEVLVVEDQALREKLSPHAYNQKQITTSSQLLVFVARTNVEARIEQYFQGISGGNADARAGLKNYENMMRGALKFSSEEAAKSWTAKQAYIALGFGLAACAELQVDSCPMEGFNSPEFDKILALPKDHYSVALLAIGYRDPAVPGLPKFRFPDADLFKLK